MIIFGLNGTAAFKTLFDLAVKKVANKWIVPKEAQKKGLLVRSCPTHNASEGSLAVHKRFLKPEYFAIEERLKEKSQEKRRRSQERKLRGVGGFDPPSLPEAFKKFYVWRPWCSTLPKAEPVITMITLCKMNPQKYWFLRCYRCTLRQLVIPLILLTFYWILLNK